MKKCCIWTIAIVLAALGVILFYKLTGEGENDPSAKGQGTLVKECREWKKHYI